MGGGARDARNRKRAALRLQGTPSAAFRGTALARNGTEAVPYRFSSSAKDTRGRVHQPIAVQPVWFISGFSRFDCQIAQIKPITQTIIDPQKRASSGFRTAGNRFKSANFFNSRLS